jgi:histone H4
MAYDELISRTAIERLAHRSGVRRVTELCYEEMKGIVNSFVWEVLKECLVSAKQANRKSITLTDVLHAVKERYLVIRESVTDDEVKTCKAPPQGKKQSKIVEDPGMVFHHRLMKFYYKQRKCVYISKDNFDKYVATFNLPKQFTREAMNILHITTEDYIMYICKYAAKVALNARRVSIYPKDIHLVKAIYESFRFDKNHTRV